MLLTLLVFYSDYTPSVSKELAIPQSHGSNKPVKVSDVCKSLLPKLSRKLKTKCCEKYKKNNRCKRCPCFDLIEQKQAV